MNCQQEFCRRPYRSRDGMILGVCKGLAEYLSMPTWAVRFFVVIAALFGGLWPMLGLYVLAGIVMQPQPVVPLADASEGDFYDSYARDPERAMGGLRQRYTGVERRLRRLEDLAVSREKDFDRRLGQV